MGQNLKLTKLDTKEVLFNYTPDDKEWWITGFDPSHPNAQYQNLKLEATLDFTGYPDFFDKFSKDYNYKGSLWTFTGSTAKLTW